MQTFTFEGVPDGVALEKLRFEDLGDGRTRLTATSLVDSFEDHPVLRYDIPMDESGFYASYHKLTMYYYDAQGRRAPADFHLS